MVHDSSFMLHINFIVSVYAYTHKSHKKETCLLDFVFIVSIKALAAPETFRQLYKILI